MNFPSNYREAFEEAVRRGLCRPEDAVRVECRFHRDEIAAQSYRRHYLDGRFLFELVDSPFSDGAEVRFAEPARTPHRPNSRLAAHEARWHNA